MVDKIIDPFTNVETPKLPETVDWGQQNLTNIGTLSAGGGTSSFKFDQKSGIWLGAERFADAPFSIDMQGNVIANSIKLAGFNSASSAAGTNQEFTSANEADVTNGSVTFTLNRQTLIMILVDAPGYLQQGGTGDFFGSAIIRIKRGANILNTIVCEGGIVAGEGTGGINLTQYSCHYVGSFAAGEHTVKLTGLVNQITGTTHYFLYSYRISIVSLGVI